MEIAFRSSVAFLVLQALALVAPGVLSTPTQRPVHERPTPESCVACSDPAEGAACHQIAIDLAERRDFARAIPIEERVLIVKPEDPEVAAALARMHQNGTRDGVRAIKLYHEALYLVPGYPPALLGLGEIMKSKGETEIAERYFARGARENPDHPLFKVRLAEVLVESGRAGQAQPILDEIVARWPGSGEAASARKLMNYTTLAKP